MFLLIWIEDVKKAEKLRLFKNSDKVLIAILQNMFFHQLLSEPFLVQ